MGDRIDCKKCKGKVVEQIIIDASLHAAAGLRAAVNAMWRGVWVCERYIEFRHNGPNHK